MRPMPQPYAMAAPAGGYGMELDPLLKERLQKPRGVFVTGHKVRMNIIPFFVNILVPWAVFIFSCSVVNFRLHWDYGSSVWYIIGFAVLCWLGLVGLAVWARRSEPDPTWFTYAAVAVGLAIVMGAAYGDWNYETHYKKYYGFKDLKWVENMDAGKERGQNHMDAGIINFAAGNKLDASRTWHFKHGTLYCVAPVVPKSGAPETGSYDYWAVGKDCCSTSSSDFRCGSFDNKNARSGLRVLDDKDRPFFRLAVEQAESIYGLRASYPIFLHWAQDPADKANQWRSDGFERFLCGVAAYGCVSVTLVALVAFKFAFIGRGGHWQPEDVVYETPEEEPLQQRGPGGQPYPGPVGWQGGPPPMAGPPGLPVDPVSMDERLEAANRVL